MRDLSTSDLARAVGIHANTVRRYAEKGLIPPAERSPAGYRRFTQRHVDCLRVAWLVKSGPFAGFPIHLLGKRLLQALVADRVELALALAQRRLALVRREQEQAELAAQELERWAQEQPEPGPPTLHIGQVAFALGISIDVVRSWDRNGLLEVPRDPRNGYRLYGEQELSRLRIIRLLWRAGYSLSAILRMLYQLDEGATDDLRYALNTPRPDEETRSASDRWLTTLADQEQRAQTILGLLQAMQRDPTTLP